MRAIKIKPITEATGRWDDDENSLYEDLYCSKYDCSYRELMERWSKEPFNVGDIIMVNSSDKSSTGSNFVTPHRVFVVSSVLDTEKDFDINCYYDYHTDILFAK